VRVNLQVLPRMKGQIDLFYKPCVGRKCFWYPSLILKRCTQHQML